MLNQLIEKIHENSTIKIQGKDYTALTKTIYSPLSDTNLTYTKIVLTGHQVLVIIPYLNFICLGHVENIFGTGKDFPDTIMYKGIDYKKIDEDYQIVRTLSFGDPCVAEGEVFYADYVNDNSDFSISLGVISRNNQRADIVQKVISLNEIEVM
mgnify:CR=1 FL=1